MNQVKCVVTWGEGSPVGQRCGECPNECDASAIFVGYSNGDFSWYCCARCACSEIEGEAFLKTHRSWRRDPDFPSLKTSAS